MVTRCCFCGGSTELRRVRAENWWGEELALVENVPAWVCVNCGEPYYEAETCRRLDRLRTSRLSALRTLKVPVYALEENEPARDRQSGHPVGARPSSVAARPSGRFRREAGSS
jgi:YgiT-type zinc finger domain-containing protein